MECAYKSFLPFIFILFYIPRNHAGYGGNDIFTSLEAMRRLWAEERIFVEKIEQVIRDMKTIVPEMERYVESHKKLELNQEPNVDYLGHPINGYNLIKHAAMGWKNFHFKINPHLNETITNLDYMQNRANNTAISGYDEIEGAAFGIARLQSQYNLDPNKMFKEGIIETHLNLKHIKSEPSIRKFTSDDLFQIGKEGVNNGLENVGIDSMKCAIEVHQQELARMNETDEEYLNLWVDEPIDLQSMEQYYKKIVDRHDLRLLKSGSRTQNIRRFTYPVGNTLSKKEIKKIAKNEKKLAQTKLIREDKVEDPYTGSHLVDHYVAEEHNFKIDYQKEMLCAGQPFRNASEDKDLKCFYAHNNSPWLRLAPIKIDMQNHEPYIAVIRELMYTHECDGITNFLGKHLGSPPGRMKAKGAVKNDWTMKNAWPDEDSYPALEKMTRRVQHITGLLSSSKLKESDNFMCGNYGIGGHYGVHPDYHKYSDPSYNINRVSTVLSVLDDPEAGGATVWPFIGVNVFPEKGSAVWWFNTKSDSVPDLETKHAACPVLLGQKWIGNKWIGYAPQFRTRPCDLKPNTRYKGVYARKNSF